MRKMIAEHGLAYNVELEDQSFMFDTGGMQQTFMHNIRTIEPNVKKLDTVILSHGHHDHVGGLLPLLTTREKLGCTQTKVICHPHSTKQRYVIAKEELRTNLSSTLDTESLLNEGAIKKQGGLSHQSLVDHGALLVYSREPVVVYDNDQTGIRMMTTGEIPRVHEKRFFPDYYLIDIGKKLVKDEFMDDQGLIIEKKGEYVFLFLGCCHAGIENTVEKVKTLSKLPIKAIIGGFHLTGVPETQVRKKISFMEGIANEVLEKPGPSKLILRPTHCSGEIFYLLLKEKCIKRDSWDIDRLPTGTQIHVG